jgi:hypothetical protein
VKEVVQDLKKNSANSKSIKIKEERNITKKDTNDN